MNEKFVVENRKAPSDRRIVSSQPFFFFFSANLLSQMIISRVWLVHTLWSADSVVFGPAEFVDKSEPATMGRRICQRKRREHEKLV